MRDKVILLAAFLTVSATSDVRGQPSPPDTTNALRAQEATRAFVQPLDLMNPGLADTERPQIDCTAARPMVRGNDVDITLSIKYSDHLIWNPDTGQNDKVNLRTYYDCLVGPTLTVNPGNRIRLLLRNDLPVNDANLCPLVMNTPDCFNSGNMHTHGLHVSPAGNGDNVLISVDPGHSFPYEYNIPSDHPAGTFWYHSHRHGSTALSVTSGMEGVLIVKGKRPYQDRDKNNRVVDIDTILHDKAGHEFKERVLLFQQIAYGCFSDPKYETLETDAAKKWVCKQDEVGVVENYKLQFGPRSWLESGRYTGVNGKVQPLFQARTGEIERWRLIHGGVRDTINFQIVKAANVPVASTEPGSGPVLRPMAAIKLASTGAVQEVMSGAEALRGDALKNFVDQSCAATDSATATQFEIAEDGLTRREITPKTLNILNPGQRSDVLVFFNEAGLYCVLDQGGPGENTIIRDRGSKSRRLLALVVVSGGQPVSVAPRDYLRSALIEGNSDLPPTERTALAAFDISAFAFFPPHGPSGDLSGVAVTGHPSALFDISLKPPPDPQHADILGLIQNSAMGPDPLPYAHDQSYKATLGTVDEWTLGVGKNFPAKHVFHIHVNPFQIMDIKGPDGASVFDASHHCTSAEQTKIPQYCDQYLVFRDTVFVMPGYVVIARTRYDDYIGEFVMHCHILDHEDQGMMQNVTIGVPSRRSLPATEGAPHH